MWRCNNQSFLDHFRTLNQLCLHIFLKKFLQPWSPCITLLLLKCFIILYICKQMLKLYKTYCFMCNIFLINIQHIKLCVCMFAERKSGGEIEFQHQVNLKQERKQESKWEREHSSPWILAANHLQWLHRVVSGETNIFFYGTSQWLRTVSIIFHWSQICFYLKGFLFFY